MSDGNIWFKILQFNLIFVFFSFVSDDHQKIFGRHLWLSTWLPIQPIISGETGPEDSILQRFHINYWASGSGTDEGNLGVTKMPALKDADRCWHCQHPHEVSLLNKGMFKTWRMPMPSACSSCRPWHATIKTYKNSRSGLFSYFFLMLVLLRRTSFLDTF